MNIAIVTGASSGMGREFVRQLGGYVSVDEIWAVARRASALETLKAETSVPVRPIVLDLLEESSFTELEVLLEAEKPNVMLLVNAAGFGKFGAYQKVPVEDDCRMIDLNCKALLLMTRLCVPYMQPGSHILELDSLSAFQPVPYITTYAATKAFVLSYSRAMNRELKAKGIRCTADKRAEKTGYKIREAQMAKVPYMIVVGDKEQEDGTVAVRLRDTTATTWSKPALTTCTTRKRTAPSTASPSNSRCSW